MKHRCNECGTYGKFNTIGNFVSDDWIRANELQEEISKLKKELDEALNLINQYKMKK